MARPMERGLGRQANERPLELADVAADHLGDEQADLVGELDVLELRLLAHDGHPRLELGRLDVGDEAPLEARHEPLLHLVELLGVLVAGDDDLLARLVQGVERVEELFLRLGLARQEVDVVDQQHVAPVAVARAELVHPLVLQRLDELVHEPLGADVDDARAGLLLAHAVGEGMHQVGLAQAGASADEQRVVAPSADPGGRHGRGVGQLVGRPDHEVRERVLRVEALDRGCGDGHARLGHHGVDARGGLVGSRGSDRERARAHGRERCGPVGDGPLEGRVDRPPHLDAQACAVAQLLVHGGKEVLLHPLPNELVARTQAEHTVGEPVELYAREPLIEARRGLLPGERDGLGPRTFGLVHHDGLGTDRRGARAAHVITLHPRLHRFPRNDVVAYGCEPATLP